MAEHTHRARGLRPGFYNQAPSNTMSFPKNANMTAVEILAFFPNSIRCADVVHRLISNGGSRKSIHSIVNTYRDLEAEWSVNCCGEAMYRTMDRAGYPDWTVKRHSHWHVDRQKALWNENNLDVSNLRTASGGPPGEAVSFSRLAENMRALPEGDDALDLTRMVQYCTENVEDGWKYPEDYEELLELLGGPAKVGDQSTDGAAFKRWENRRPPPTLSRITQPSQSTEAGRGQRRSRSTSSGPGSLMKRRTARASTRRGTEQLEQLEQIENRDCSNLNDEHGTPYMRAPVSITFSGLSDE